MDCEVDDSPEPGKDFTADDEQVCSWTNSRPDEPSVTTESDPHEPHQDPEPALNRNESVTSSMSDTPSSADSVYENEAHRNRKDPEQNPHPEQDPDPEQDPHPEQDADPEQGPHPEQDHPQHLEEDRELDLYLQPEPDPDLMLYPQREEDPERDSYPQPEPESDLDSYPQPEPDTDLDSYPQPEPDMDLDSYPQPESDTDLDSCSQPEPDMDQDSNPQPDPDPDLDSYPQPEPDMDLDSYRQPDPDLDLYPDPEQDPELGLYPESEFDPGGSNLNPEYHGYLNLPICPDEDPEALETPFDSPAVEASVLEQCIRAQALSDGSSESCQDPDCDQMVQCLRADVAAASSDEETDEKWRTIFSSSINKEDDDSYLDSLQLSAQELFVHKVEETDFAEQDNNDFEGVCFEVPQVDEILEQPEDFISFPVPPQEVKYNPLGLQGLSKISEDENEICRDAGQNHASADTTKKLPKDFCVIQETKSENVSTEHVDFQLARKQWREMEEQTKKQGVLPTTKQHSFHSSHSFMYTPVRNIQRMPRRAQELESLTLGGEYPHSQFSPCSEDSGLDDSSYRSPHDDPETPVEREIRIAMEREDNFKRERGLSRMGKSTDCAPSRGIPRSVSTPLTPSFIITSSPTKEPLKQQVSTNNVVIVDPGNDFSPSPHGKDNMAACSAEWRSEDGSSNLIILETSNLIIRSASEFSLSRGCDSQEKTFLNNPFFKLRSRSSMSLVDQEIQMVKQREEELKKERAGLYASDTPHPLYASDMPRRLDTLTFGHSVDVPMKCKSSPSSPMKTSYRMDRSALSCDQRYPDVFVAGRRKSAMALRWEAGEFTKTD